MEEKTVVLCPNPYKDADLELTGRCRELLENAGFRVRISPVYLDGDTPLPHDGEAFRELTEAVEGAVLVVSLGGDGTIMHTARRLIGHRVPIIGVNLGTVGFLAELEKGEISHLVEAAKGNYTPSPRMMLRIEVERSGETVFADYALNDAAIHGINKTIHIVARGDGRRILEFNGDGVVVSSPTGSTAYSLAAGGPLVEPTAENILLTPICAHALAVRSFVLAPDRAVAVTVDGFRGREAIVSADGGRFDLKDGDTIHVKKAGHRTILAHVGTKAFYDIVFEKLGERT